MRNEVDVASISDRGGLLSRYSRDRETDKLVVAVAPRARRSIRRPFIIMYARSAVDDERFRVM